MDLIRYRLVRSTYYITSLLFWGGTTSGSTCSERAVHSDLMLWPWRRPKLSFWIPLDCTFLGREDLPIVTVSTINASLPLLNLLSLQNFSTIVQLVAIFFVIYFSKEVLVESPRTIRSMLDRQLLRKVRWRLPWRRPRQGAVHPVVNTANYCKWPMTRMISDGGSSLPFLLHGPLYDFPYSRGWRYGGHTTYWGASAGCWPYR